jgi:hypothetical protein
MLSNIPAKLAARMRNWDNLKELLADTTVPLPAAGLSALFRKRLAPLRLGLPKVSQLC